VGWQQPLNPGESMKRYLALVNLTLMLFACSKAPEPIKPAIQPVSHDIAWRKPDGTNITDIFAMAKSANKPVFCTGARFGARLAIKSRPPCSTGKTLFR
jgi:starvation-inducible outer membrane lipoprotein